MNDVAFSSWSNTLSLRFTLIFVVRGVCTWALGGFSGFVAAIAGLCELMSCLGQWRVDFCIGRCSGLMTEVTQRSGQRCVDISVHDAT